ncbi:hypothetical protein DDE82_006615 [Stemphylium lycopersici]|nr:hypothetical protein DDE82_006615 [Stemphylium lycopersici]
MVTTRGGTETPGAPTPTPRSSTRKQAGKRELEALETPTQTKRQRKAPKATAKKGAAKEVKSPDGTADEPSQDSSNDTSDTIAVAAPTEDAPQTPKQGGKARQKSNPQAVAGGASTEDSSNTEGKDDDVPSTAQNPAFYTPVQAPGSVYATPYTHKQPEGSPTPKAKAMKDQTPSAAAKKGRGRPRKTPQKEIADLEEEIPSSTYESEMAPIPSQQSIPPSAQPEKTHMRFGSEEPTQSQDSPAVNKPGKKLFEASEPAPASPQTESDADASDSDDEAPEVVTTAAASSKALAARAEADRARKAQQAKEQAKRQAREEFLAAQQAAKREREEKKAKKLAKRAAKEAKASAGTNEDDEDAEEDAEPSTQIDTSNGLLPASLLETIDDQRPPTPPPARRGQTEEQRRKEKLNKHIKFLERTDRPTKDIKKGKLSVAVLAQQNKVMPPKLSRQTKNVREHWLKGREAEKKKKQQQKVGGGGKPRFGRMERRPHVSHGFMRNGDD